MHTGLDSPPRVWWLPLHGAERIWVTVAFAWCLVLFAMMPLWQLKGQQNPSGIRHKVEPTRYYQRVQEYWRWQVRSGCQSPDYDALRPRIAPSTVGEIFTIRTHSEELALNPSYLSLSAK